MVGREDGHADSVCDVYNGTRSLGIESPPESTLSYPSTDPTYRGEILNRPTSKS